MIENLITELFKTALSKNITVACVESCTGGHIASSITSKSGSSEFFYGGIIPYHNHLKNTLGVKKETIQIHGSVSKECCRELLESGQRFFNTTHLIATTGIAGPLGATPGKPVGTVYIGVLSPQGCLVKKFNFNGSRSEIINQSTFEAINQLIKVINNE